MAKGVSLHIGLNRISKEHYGEGIPELFGCVNDANAMNDIALSKGYKPTILLDGQATSGAVSEHMHNAASELETGDIFLVTYSGHGGRIKDENGDEEDFYDETWCLFDRMMIDDEIFSFWGKFKKGVRIFVLSDSCHSGTVVRAIPSFDLSVVNQRDISYIGRKRSIGADAALRVYTRNREFYDELIGGLRNVSEKSAVAASVILISGCQDDQYSLDGDSNGLFTEKLLEVWNTGAFTGSYRGFHSEICSLMPNSQIPNFYTAGKKDADFEDQTPFTI